MGHKLFVEDRGIKVIKRSCCWSQMNPSRSTKTTFLFFPFFSSFFPFSFFIRSRNQSWLGFAAVGTLAVTAVRGAAAARCWSATAAVVVGQIGGRGRDEQRGDLVGTAGVWCRRGSGGWRLETKNTTLNQQHDLDKGHKFNNANPRMEIAKAQRVMGQQKNTTNKIFLWG